MVNSLTEWKLARTMELEDERSGERFKIELFEAVDTERVVRYKEKYYVFDDARNSWKKPPFDIGNVQCAKNLDDAESEAKSMLAIARGWQRKR